MSDVETHDEWFQAHRVFGSEPSQRTVESSADDPEPTPDRTTAVDLDTSQNADSAAAEPDPNAGAKKAAGVLAALLVVAALGIVAVLVGSRGDDPPAARPVSPPTAPVAPAAAPTTAESPPDQDRAVAYTASANCPAGSTSAQSLTDPHRHAPWTCVRGQQGARVDGQVLRVDLGGSYVLSAVKVTPGWIAETPGAPDEWLQHRVVSRLQYSFDDADRTIVTQDTGDVHGPVTIALPHRVLASHVTVIVLQTARPSTSPPGSTAPSATTQPGFGDSTLGPFGAPVPPDGTEITDPVPTDESGDDPVDATFAISALTFLGHPPR